MKRRNFLGYALLFAGGCATATTTTRTNPSSVPATSKPAKLRLAISDVKGMEDLKQDYEQLRTTLEQILSLPVEFVPVESYIAAASALQFDQVDLVFTGPSEYVVMRARTNAVPIAAVRRQKYYSIFCARAGSPFKTLADLKGKTIAMWSLGSTSGYIDPISLLIQAGLDPKVDVKIELLGKQGLPRLKAGAVDVWAGSVARYDKFLIQEQLTAQDLPILTKGPTLPADPFIVNSKLDPAWIQQIQASFIKHQARILQSIALSDGEKFAGAKMISIDDTEYNGLRQVYKIMGEGAFL